MRLQHRLALVLTALVVATGIAAVGPAGTAAAAAPTTGRFTPLDTTRVWSGSVPTTATVIPIAGHGGVPANATAVVVNVEVENPTAAGTARVTPAGVSSGVTSQAYRKGQTVSALQTVRLVGGKVQVQLSAGKATVYLDVSGYYANGSGATFTPLNAARVFAKKVGTTPTKVPLAGRAGIPSTATAVAVNTEVGTPSANGYVRVTPAGKDARVAAQVFTKGTTISNLVIVKLVGGAAQVKVSSGTATVFMDVAGYYANTSTGSVYVPVNPVRAASTSLTTTPRTIRLSGTAGVPGTATAIVATATTTTARTTASSYLRFTPSGQDPQVATQVLGAGQTLSNAVMTKLVGSTVDRRAQAKVSVGTASLTVDVAGYFMDGSSGSGFGADVSWPQGGSSASYPKNQAFGIVGVNNGLATTTNPYLAQQLAWAKTSTGGTSQPKTQLYVNTANPGQYFADNPTVPRTSWPTSNVDPGGKTVPASASGNPYGTCVAGTAALTSTQCSWMYGWNRAYEDAKTRGVTSPGSYRWWLDAETDGSWQKTTTLNRATLEGMTAYFVSIGATVGVYSSPAEWSTLFGVVPASSRLYALPTWRAIGTATAASAQAACSAAPYVAGGRTTMVQYVTGSTDNVVSCV